MNRKIILSVLLLTLISGCERISHVTDESGQSQQLFEWVVVDNHEINRILNDIALTQNPYPEGSQSNQSDLKFEKRELSTQVSEIERQNKERCRKTEDPVHAENRTAIKLHRAVQFRGYDQDCLKNLPEDQLVNDLKARIQKIKKQEQVQSRHREKLLIAVRSKLPQIVSAFAANKYQLVLEKNVKVLHSSDGVVVDITKALATKLRESPPTIKLNERQ